MSSLLVKALTSTREEIAAKKMKEGVSSKFWPCRIEKLTSLNVERKRRIQCLGQHILDSRPDLDLEDLDPERKVLERKSKHFGERVVLHLGLVSKLSEKMERESLLDSTGSSSSLSSVAFGDPGLHELGNLTLLVEPEGIGSQHRSREGTKRTGTNLISLCFPLSITQTMSGMVTPVSAMLVEMTILRTPGGGLLKTAAWPSDETLRGRRGAVSFVREGDLHSRKRGGRLTSSAAGRSQSFQRFRRRRGLARGR
jgi:hypothetical protein